MNKKTLSLFFTLLFLTSLQISSALGVSVSPARYELTGDKGSVVYGEFTVINQSSNDQVYGTSVENFTAQGETGVPLFTKDNKDIASWIQIDKRIVVAKNEKKTVEFSIIIPENAEAGGHFGAVFLYSDPGESGEANVSLGTKVGMLVLLKVNGDIKLGGDIKDFSASSPSDTDKVSKTFFTELPVNFSYRFTNSGNDRVNPYGVITIKNMFGLKSDILSANSNQGNVLPQSTRKFDVLWGKGEKEELVNNDSFFAKALYQWRHFALGYYTATLKIAYDIELKKGINESADEISSNIESSTAIASKTSKVFILPWQLLIVITFSALLFLVVFVNGLKRYNKWIIKQAKAHTHK
jgi:hypothetical protein